VSADWDVVYAEVRLLGTYNGAGKTTSLKMRLAVATSDGASLLSPPGALWWLEALEMLPAIERKLPASLGFAVRFFGRSPSSVPPRSYLPWTISFISVPTPVTSTS